MKRSPIGPKTFQEALAKKKSKQPPFGYIGSVWTSPIKPKKAPPKKKKVQTISKLKKLLWDECRRIVRAKALIDIPTDNYHCFTCGNLTPIPHTGHIIASSLCSASMRYDLDNLRLQCYMCNIHKSGNWVSFYERLGKDYIDDLIRRNNETKFQSYHTDWYLKKIEEYKLL